jgi:hypothetical protein
MKKHLTRYLSIGFVLFIGIQFIVPSENHCGNFQNDMAQAYVLPENVYVVLKTSCFNCHSNYTNYPWYTRIQPVRWWITSHIHDGKEKLNFSNFLTYDTKTRYSRFKKIEANIKAGAMPLPSYLTTHPEGRLSEEQKTVLIDWAKSMQDSMKSIYPLDSLEVAL